jgi:hypothetical protein
MNEEKPEEAAATKQSIYPDPEAIKKKKLEQSASAPLEAQEAKYQQASKDFTDLIVLGSGIGSAVFLLGLVFLLDNMWIPYISSGVLAAISIVSAVQNFKKTHTLTPFTVIGLSAATFTLMYILNFLIAQAVIRSNNSLY